MGKRHMPGLTKRKGIEVWQFDEAVPTDVVEALRGVKCDVAFPDAPDQAFIATIGRHVRASLKTTDRGVAETRASAIRAQLASLYHQARLDAPTPLSQRQRVALSGLIYRLLHHRHGENPGHEDLWARFKATSRAAYEGRAIDVPPLDPDNPEASIADALRHVEDVTGTVNAAPKDSAYGEAALKERYGAWVQIALEKAGILKVSDADYRDLLKQFHAAATDAAWSLKKAAGDDYSPDPKANRFPEFVPPSSTPTIRTTPATRSALTITDLVDRWERLPGKFETKSDRTKVRYRQVVVEEFGGFLRNRAGHTDATRIRREDVVAWKDHLFERGLTVKTVKSNKLAALNAVLGLAYADGLIPANHAAGLKIGTAKAPVTRSKSLQDAEARAILIAARHYRSERAPPKTKAAFQWAPVLLAFTGARVAEVLQLRREDVLAIGSAWAIRITPEAGSTKSSAVRFVPVHSGLVTLGFIDFVTRSRSGPLFHDATGTKAIRNRVDGLAKDLAAWARNTAGVDDPKVRPNHGWRHRFSTQWRNYAGQVAGEGVRRGRDEALDSVLGHNSGGISAEYGEFEDGALRPFIERIPATVLYPVPGAFDAPKITSS